MGPEGLPREKTVEESERQRRRDEAVWAVPQGSDHGISPWQLSMDLENSPIHDNPDPPTNNIPSLIEDDPNELKGT